MERQGLPPRIELRLLSSSFQTRPPKSMEINITWRERRCVDPACCDAFGPHFSALGAAVTQLTTNECYRDFSPDCRLPGSGL
jgi:hypothetical protein